VLDKWFPQRPTTYTVTRQLTQGPHDVVLEYFEAGGGAVAKFGYEQTSDPLPPPPPPEPFTSEYFDNSSLSGPPVLTQGDEAIDFDWGEGAPSPLVPVNNFSARWTRTKSYAAGTYRLSVTGDDGIRVLVDGTQVIDGWFYQGPTTYTADVPLSEGQHTWSSNISSTPSARWPDSVSRGSPIPRPSAVEDVYGQWRQPECEHANSFSWQHEKDSPH
jgi:hypothetical protein